CTALSTNFISITNHEKKLRYKGVFSSILLPTHTIIQCCKGTEANICGNVKLSSKMGRPNPVPTKDSPTSPGKQNHIAARLARGLSKMTSTLPARNDENARPADPHRTQKIIAKLEEKIRGPRAELFNPGLFFDT